MFSKYELLFLDQANSSSDPSQILILQFPILRVSLPLSPSLSNFNHPTPQHGQQQNCRCFFILTTLLAHTITLKYRLKVCSSTSVDFYLPIPPLLVHKIILTISNNTLFLCTFEIFHFPIFAYNHPNSLHQKYFPYLSHLANSGCVTGPGSYGVLWGHTVLICLFLLKAWTVITGVTITLSLSLYCSGLENCSIAGSSLWWRCLQLEYQIIRFQLLS